MERRAVNYHQTLDHVKAHFLINKGKRHQNQSLTSIKGHAKLSADSKIKTANSR
jgi:hypothetical protein